jgi:hypothetical protein
MAQHGGLGNYTSIWVKAHTFVLTLQMQDAVWLQKYNILRH